MPVGPDIPGSAQDAAGFARAVQAIYSLPAVSCTPTGLKNGDLIQVTGGGAVDVLAAAPSFGPTATAMPTPPAQTVSVSFEHTGAPQTWTAPPGVTRATFAVFGAQGGGAGSVAGGNGGWAVADLAVTPGAVYQINVGGRGGDGTSGYSNSGRSARRRRLQRRRRGGTGDTYPGADYTSGAGGGGGASDVRAGGLLPRRPPAGGRRRRRRRGSTQLHRASGGNGGDGGRLGVNGVGSSDDADLGGGGAGPDGPGQGGGSRAIDPAAGAARGAGGLERLPGRRRRRGRLRRRGRGRGRLRRPGATAGAGARRAAASARPAPPSGPAPGPGTAR